MEQSTPHLDLPYIMPSQAQKHITHNEALDVLDAVIQLCVRDRDLAAPPIGPVEGDRYLVAAPATGAWEGRDGAIAVFREGGWLYHAPRPGWLAVVIDEVALLIFDGEAWKPLSEMLVTLQNLARLGVGTAADAESPFAAKLNTALWTARAVSEGGSGDLRYTMNKEAARHTLSLLLQSGYSGRAEIGLIGNDDLSLKVSPDGNTWHSAYSVSYLNGATAFSAGVRFNNTFGVGRSGSVTGGIYFNRFPDNPFLLFSAGSPSEPADIGQFRANHASSYIGISNATGGIWGLAYQTTLGRVGIMTSDPDDTLSINGIAAPKVDNAFSCGTAARRWSVIYAATGTINTSDARDKLVEAPIGTAAARIVDRVAPVFFRWKAGGTDIIEAGTKQVEDGVDTEGNPAFIETPVTEERPRTGERVHAGWLAQDIKAALDSEGIDCAAWGLDDRDDSESRQWLRPDQLVALLWQALRETREELKALANI